MWNTLSNEIAEATALAERRLVHVGGHRVAGRTGLVWAPGLVVTVARQAQAGEAVPVEGPSGPLGATVRAWNPRTGLTLVDVPGLDVGGWVGAPVPALGSLVLSVARPSPHGPEARLDLVRFVGQGVIQLDGPSFPGFTGAAVVDDQGRLVGMVVDNQPGNGGAVEPFAGLQAAVDQLLAEGTPQRAWLGVSTRPAGGQGLALVAVEDGSPADQAGWRAGDLLVSLAGRPLGSPQDLVAVLATLSVAEAVDARILRDAEIQSLPVKPGAQ